MESASKRVLPLKSHSVDVNRLDKVNAYLNKNSHNILTEGLCLHDRQFIRAIMEDDSSESDLDKEVPCGSSTWSPMVQSPLMMNKRMRKSRPPSAVALSLEDISYIRPSWGLSKGIKTIKVNKRKTRKKILKSERRNKEENEKPSQSDQLYRYLFVLLALVILLLTIPTYIRQARKEKVFVDTNRIRLNPRSRLVELYRNGGDTTSSILKLNIAKGIPSNLKSETCSCDSYEKHARSMNWTSVQDGDCIVCLDWAVRANLRVYLDRHSEDSSNCYKFKWQSYDSLVTPLIDCFQFEDNQWFGIGDLHAPIWPLDKLQFDWTTIRTNLTYETKNITTPRVLPTLSLGSYVNFSLFSTKGITIGEVRTDFEVAVKLQRNPQTGAKSLCISASCTDKCTQNWVRKDHLNVLRYSNNMLEYSICAAPNLKTLIARRFKKTGYYNQPPLVPQNDTSETVADDKYLNSSTANKLLEREAFTQTYGSEAHRVEAEPLRAETYANLPDGIGLIERTVFSTELMPVLDGQTLRQFVDNIVKLGLKSSSIILIDSRWETYAGSLKLNTALFPKAKLLFEILHNRGFKIVFTVKPYIDAGVGVMNLNQLLNAGRLYTVEYRNDHYIKWRMNDQQRSEKMALKEYVIRRRSLFSFENQSITIGLDEGQTLPYIFKCTESQEGYCALTDLTQQSNIAWMINGIMRSSFTTLGADGIQIGGLHPDNLYWDDHYREGMSVLVKSLMLKEKFYTIPQWTGDYGYIQLAPRTCDWHSLRSVINSVQNLGMMGFSLVHPGSVWGDLNSTRLSSQQEPALKSLVRVESIYGDIHQSEHSDEELVIRWLQVAMFLPILQFNSIAPIEKYGLHELVQNLTRIRKNYIVPELKQNLPYTPLISHSKLNMNNFVSALIRPVWHNNESGELAVPEQFMIGPNILVAPILSDGQRQRDIYLPNGFWRDELKQENIRGGRWLRNYPIELNEIAWFNRARR